MESIARQIARGIAEFFGLPFVAPMEPEEGRVSVSYGALNLRSYPSSEGSILARMPNGARVTVYGQWQGWYTVRYEGLLGYAAAAYIDT